MRQSNEEEEAMLRRTMTKSTGSNLKIGYFLLALVAACFIAGVTTGLSGKETTALEKTTALETSESCSDDVEDPCYQNQCQAHGDVDAVCVPQGSSYDCDCSAQYDNNDESSETKAPEVDTCYPRQHCVDKLLCGDHGECHSIPLGGYYCVCDTGYVEVENKGIIVCEEFDSCTENSIDCLNGGLCIDDPSPSSGWSCDCPDGYEAKDDGLCYETNPCECEETNKKCTDTGGDCIDEDPPSTESHCDCPTCYNPCNDPDAEGSVALTVGGDYCCNIDPCVTTGDSHCNIYKEEGSPPQLCFQVDDCNFDCDCTSGYESCIKDELPTC